MAKQQEIQKTYLKTWVIGGHYCYKIYEVDAGGEKWFLAEPTVKGVTRCAENEQILHILLENDARNMNRTQQKVR